MCAWKVFIVRGLGLLCNVKHGCFEQKNDTPTSISL